MLAVLKAAAELAISVVPLFFSRPGKPNPIMSAIQDLQNAEKAKNDAEAAAKAAQDLADKIKRDAEQEREWARVRQEEADRATARATAEMERMKVQMEEATKAVKHAAELAEAASKAAAEDAARLTQEAQQERARAQKIREDAERVTAVAKEEAERAQKAADETRREAEEDKARAEEMARKAAEEARKANEAKENAKRRMNKGIQPVVMPSPEEVTMAKTRIQYREDCFHFAVTGISGSGKSSLVNAFRGLRSSDPGAAAVGVSERVLQVTRYQDANPENPFVWYHVPSAGVLKCSDWKYFNDQGFYVFDCIIILVENRFTATDIAIVSNARRFEIPTYVVCSKADQHIRNAMKEMGYDSDEEDIERRDKLYQDAREQFIDKTKKSIQVNLEDANLPDQRAYIVSSNTLLSIVLNKMSKKAIDEVDLLNDLFDEAYKRRKGDPGAE